MCPYTISLWLVCDRGDTTPQWGFWLLGLETSSVPAHGLAILGCFTLYLLTVPDLDPCCWPSLDLSCPHSHASAWCSGLLWLFPSPLCSLLAGVWWLDGPCLWSPSLLAWESSPSLKEESTHCGPWHYKNSRNRKGKRINWVGEKKMEERRKKGRRKKEQWKKKERRRKRESY